MKKIAIAVLVATIISGCGLTRRELPKTTAPSGMDTRAPQHPDGYGTTQIACGDGGYLAIV